MMLGSASSRVKSKGAKPRVALLLTTDLEHEIK